MNVLYSEVWFSGGFLKLTVMLMIMCLQSLITGLKQYYKRCVLGTLKRCIFLCMYNPNQCWFVTLFIQVRREETKQHTWGNSQVLRLFEVLWNGIVSHSIWCFLMIWWDWQKGGIAEKSVTTLPFHGIFEKGTSVVEEYSVFRSFTQVKLLILCY